jgi:L-asparaginase
MRSTKIPKTFPWRSVSRCVAALIAALLPAPLCAQAQLPVCPLIATGGTIAMKIDPIKKAPVPAISGEDLVATVPEVANYAQVEVKNVSNVPSDYMDPPRWIALTKEVAGALDRVARHRHARGNGLLA